jgi:hypothetical protein
MEDDMAKGQLRSNREKKKPKADKSKSKTVQPASPWSSASGNGSQWQEFPIRGKAKPQP